MSDPGSATEALLELMARLRDPAAGCPWDREQTFASIAPYTIEEAYEVADAIDRNDAVQLRDELGDLLFQVVFHSQMARERGWFGFADVAKGIHDKLVRRHPHLFGGEPVLDSQDQSRVWEELKARERAEKDARTAQHPADGVRRDTGALAGIPRALPALARAAKIGRRAARVGFDWENPGQVRDKVLEELHEVDGALREATQQRVTEELGDLLFAVANWALHLNVDPEEALRLANAKFERRFRHMEQLAAERSQPLKSLSAAAWDTLWHEAKDA